MHNICILFFLLFMNHNEGMNVHADVQSFHFNSIRFITIICIIMLYIMVYSTHHNSTVQQHVLVQYQYLRVLLQSMSAF